MSRFLSPEWFDDVRRAEPASPITPSLTLQQVVTGTPDGEVRYRILVGEEGARIERGQDAPSDMAFTTDYVTASAIARGDLSVQAALSAGRIRIGGDTARLAANHPLLSGVDPVPPVVRAATTWDDGSDAIPGERVLDRGAGADGAQ